MIAKSCRSAADYHQEKDSGYERSITAHNSLQAKNIFGICFTIFMAALMEDPPGRNQSGAVFLSLTCLSVMSVNSLSGPDAP